MMIEYLATVATVGALSSTIRCYIAVRDRKDRPRTPSVRLYDEGNFLQVLTGRE